MIEIDISKNLQGSHGEMQLCVNTHVKQKEFIVVTGESGAGKTTLLRVLAGLEDVKGTIFVNKVAWQSHNKILSAQQRDIGFVFQDYALFDNMTVEENLLFVNNDKNLARELLTLTELLALANQNVQLLSGGQKQRVALCRAMMKKPTLLLMDEPLSALDTQMKNKLQMELKALHKRFNMTTIMVSHDIPSTFALASRVWVLDDGCIVKDGQAHEVLLQKENTHKVRVLSIERSESAITVGTVALFGEVVQVEIDKKTKVGDMIDMKLKGVLV